MKHILMVDDTTTNLKSAAEVLSPYYQVSQAKSGKQALKFLENNHPDLILLDLMMPEMDGYETLERIKLNPDNAKIPVIILTADTEQASEERGLSMGAMDFIKKPFDEESMLGRIEKVLQMDAMRLTLAVDTGEDELTGFLKPDHLKKQCDSFLPTECIWGRPYAVMIDLDDFSLFIERNGEQAGEAFVSTFAKSLKCDILMNYPETLFGRSYLNELMMIFPSAVGQEEIMKICAEMIPGILHSLQEGIENVFPVTASVSAYQVNKTFANFDDVYLRLKMAMYHVKCTGKNHYHMYVGE